MAQNLSQVMRICSTVIFSYFDGGLDLPCTGKQFSRVCLLACPCCCLLLLPKCVAHRGPYEGPMQIDAPCLRSILDIVPRSG